MKNNSIVEKALLLVCAFCLTIGLPSVQAQVAFEEDFESGTMANWGPVGTQTPLTIATGTNRIPVGGNFSALLDIGSDRMWASNLTAGMGITAGSFKFTYYYYDNSGTAARVYNEVRAYTGGSYTNGTLAQLLAIGKYNAVDNTVNTHVSFGQTYNSSKYQARISSGIPNGWFNLNAPGSPNRSVGWHKFDVERGINSSSQIVLNFYVDNILSRSVTNSNANVGWDSVILGPGLGTTVGNAWLDGLKVVQGQPFVSEQPQNQTNKVGTTVLLSAQVIGNEPVTYQWEKNGTNIPGATDITLTISSAQFSDAGTYRLIASNSLDTAASLAAIVVVNPAIVIMTPPQSQRVNVGSSVEFSVVATGDGNLSYQWKKNGVDIGGATGSTYSIPTVQTSDAGNYSVVVSNDLGDPPQTSAVAVLSVNTAPTVPSISTQNGTAGSLFSFTPPANDDFSSAGILFQTFENSVNGGFVMFNHAGFSGSTLAYVDTNSPLFTFVTNGFPAGRVSSNVVAARWTMQAGTGTRVPWIRFTTATSPGLLEPNPVISFGSRLQFDIYSDRDLGVGLGARETGSAGAIGSDGGSTGNLEFVGVTALSTVPIAGTAGTPTPVRSITANNWTTLDFNIPSEPIISFNGNGILESATGKGVLEHLALVAVGAAGDPSALGIYNIYLDNFAVVPIDALSFSLENSPADASIGLGTGIITWKPSATGTYSFTVRATDSGGLSSTQTFSVNVGAGAPGPINIQQDGSNVILTWAGSYILQSSALVTGTYTDVVATSPYTNSISLNSNTFYRLRN